MLCKNLLEPFKCRMHQCKKEEGKKRKEKQERGGVSKVVFLTVITWMISSHNCSTKTSADGVIDKL